MKLCLFLHTWYSSVAETGGHGQEPVWALGSRVGSLQRRHKSQRPKKVKKKPTLFLQLKFRRHLGNNQWKKQVFYFDLCQKISLYGEELQSMWPLSKFSRKRVSDFTRRALLVVYLETLLEIEVRIWLTMSVWETAIRLFQCYLFFIQAARQAI